MAGTWPIFDAINASRAKEINRGPQLGFRLLETIGAQFVDILNYEPDAVTFRHEYYYHARQNVLYRRIWTVNKPLEGLQIAKWMKISDDAASQQSVLSPSGGTAL